MDLRSARVFAAMTSRLADEVGRLARAANPGPWTSFGSWVRGTNGTPIGKYEYRGGRLPTTLQGNRRRRERAATNARLAAAFGSPDRALAAVEALENDGHYGGELPTKRHGWWHPEGCKGCAVIRSWEQALGIAEEQSDGI